MSKPATHKVGIHGDICMHFLQDQLEGHEGQYLITQYEALELVKELLDACGESEPTTARVLVFPDSIVSSEVFKGRLLVLCQHSAWEIFVDTHDELRQKQISFVGISESDVSSDMNVDAILSHVSKSEAIQLAADILSAVTKMKEREI